MKEPIVRYVVADPLNDEYLGETDIAYQMKVGNNHLSEDEAREMIAMRPDKNEGKVVFRVTIEELITPVHPEFEKGFMAAAIASFEGSASRNAIERKARSLGITLTNEGDGCQ